MALQIVYSAGTAVLAALLSLALVYLLWTRRLRPELERKLELVLREFGDSLRHQVRQGVVDGLQSISARDVISGTRQAIGRTAEEVVKGGLASLFSTPGSKDGGGDGGDSE